MKTEANPAAAWLRAHGLRLLFVLPLAGESLPLLGLWLEAWPPTGIAPEGHWLHGLLEDALPLAVTLLLAISGLVFLRRAAPGFLHLPSTVPLSFVLLRLLFHAPLVYLGLLAGFIAVGLALEPPPWDSSNPQYIPIVFFIAAIGPFALLPAVTAVTVWRAARRMAARKG
ncbi:MAG: hypothetical protein Q8O34_11145 [Rhodocyclaceae bacterium]|nr:hypothetical protein [Rhodocyclaceae bacterium]